MWSGQSLEIVHFYTSVRYVHIRLRGRWLESGIPTHVGLRSRKNLSPLLGLVVTKRVDRGPQYDCSGEWIYYPP